MTKTIKEGVFTFMNSGGMLVPFVYDGWRAETLASKETAYFCTVLSTSPIYDVKGPDAAKFLSSICVNDFTTARPGGIRHAICCNEKGQITADGVVMTLGEEHFRTYWIMPVVDYEASRTTMNITGENMMMREFFLQIAGPKSLEIIEQAAEEDIHDLKFAKHRMIRIAGVDVRILRLGMAGTLAYELHGDMEKFEEVYKALWDIGVTYGAKKMGNQAYVMNHTEGGFPNLNMHYPLPWYEDPGLAAYLEEHPMEGFWNWNRHLVGSCGDDLEVRFRTPYDVGWGNLVNFNHEFPGKKALQKIAENPPMDVVTLEWNAEDVGEVFASQFRGRSVEPYDEIGENPVDINFNLNVSGGFIYHQDYVMLGDEKIGVSAVRTRSAYYHKMISLGFVKKEYTKPGTELEVLWGRPGTPQKKIRVTVAPVPYVDSDFTNNKYIDVEEIPHYQGK